MVNNANGPSIGGLPEAQIRLKGAPSLYVSRNIRKIELTEPVSAFVDLAADLSQLSCLEILEFTASEDICGNLAFLRAVPNLKELFLWAFTKLKDISALHECASLRDLRLGRDTKLDFRTIANLPLERFWCSLPPARMLPFLGKIVTLKHLTIEGGAKLDSLEVFSALENLEYLRLWCGKIKSTRGINCFPKLSELNLGYCNVEEFTQFQKVGRLAKLQLVGNKKLTNIEFLANTNVRNLGLFEIPRIESLSPIQSLKALTELNLEGIIGDGDVSFLAECANLRVCQMHARYREKIFKLSRSGEPCTVHLSNQEVIEISASGAKVVRTREESIGKIKRLIRKP